MQFLRFICLLLLSTLSLAATSTAHEGGKSTIILMRHAEKDLKGTDPALSKAGKKRAERLPEALKEWKPDAFYSTATKRTQQTLTPWAKNAGKTIELYDATKQEEFSRQLKHMGGKTIVVVGHSNTIPQLANLLLGANTYSDLPDNEFGKVWIIRMDHGHASAEVLDLK
jgi:2,3-bisphosphoglycerate-dependent phosphoglycerate mutase